MILFDTVTKTYAKGTRPALDAVTLEVERGEFVFISGPSGAGKTTMTYLIPRLYDPSQGRILLDGHDLRDLTLDTVSRVVQRAAQPIALTSKEYRLLEFLKRHPNQTLTRTTIAEHVWNYDFENVSNLIDVHIFGLRRKIDDGFPRPLLHTRRRVGYKLSENP